VACSLERLAMRSWCSFKWDNAEPGQSRWPVFSESDRGSTIVIGSRPIPRNYVFPTASESYMSTTGSFSLSSPNAGCLRKGLQHLLKEGGMYAVDGWGRERGY
jgi:hypothetical protein